MHKTTILLGLLACSGIAAAQTAIVIPNGFANTEGGTSNGFPWSSAVNIWPGLRDICIYGPNNFTSQSVSGPITITRLRWRADGSATSWTGGTFASATVRLATAAVAYNAPSTNIPSNFGPDLTTCYTGPVTFLAGSGSSPGPWVVDITLTTPFVYDPANGGLVIDCDISNAVSPVYSGGGTPQLDVDGAATTQASRVYISSLYPTANGTTYPHGVICEVTYNTGPGSASSSTYGSGCYNRAGSFYESFATASAFDLNNNSLTMIYNGSNGYVVVPGITTFVVPSGSATSVALGDDVEQSVTLGSTLNFPGGSTTTLDICSNGFISAAVGNGTSFSPSAAGFLAFPQACWAPCWHDFNATAPSGPIQFEEIGSVSYVTWNGVYDFATTTPSTMQVQFNRANGNVSMIWQTMSTAGSNMLTGFKSVGSVMDPGNRDIDTTLPSTFVCGLDIRALALNASARPIINTSINLVTSNVPAISGVGATILSFTQHNPGLDLTSIGMPGCSQYVGLDTSILFFPSGGTGTYAFVIPNNPSFVGAHVYSQSAAFAAGVNPLGVLASNGVNLLVGSH